MTQAHSGYNLFAASVKGSLTRAELTEPHLNADGTAAAIGFAAAVAARWRALEPEQRQEWNDRSQANQQVFAVAACVIGSTHVVGAIESLVTTARVQTGIRPSSGSREKRETETVFDRRRLRCPFLLRLTPKLGLCTCAAYAAYTLKRKKAALARRKTTQGRFGAKVSVEPLQGYSQAVSYVLLRTSSIDDTLLRRLRFLRCVGVHASLHSLCSHSLGGRKAVHLA